MTLTTLCYIEKDDSYLMLHRIKKERDINKDKWIGVGGHIETDESPDDCLIREVKEETGLTLTSYRLRGIITFLCDDITDYYIFLYTADCFEGNIKSCNEGVLEWVHKDKLVSLNLWEGDLIFFQLLEKNTSVFSLKLCYLNGILKEAVLDGRTMELFDIVDINGIPTGQVRERSLVHRYGDLHRTSHVWIIRPNGKGRFDVLLQKRAADKDSFPGTYDISSAGHVPAGMDYLESAIRELKEELGITVLPEELKFIGFHDGEIITTFYNKPFHNHEFSAVYVLSMNIPSSSFHLQKEEVETVIWMDYEDCLASMQDGTLPHCIFMNEFLALGTIQDKLSEGRLSER
ncbi:MAG: NUDIX domain-containing protein [Clostridiales bacterium]|nr:NUDIX domain-containing protein [Clostridiales bacterium]